ncbi:hypothetical protein CDAR_301671 [Caerostris darwini]|uniref:Uncharacterized protein n=1 Tax=Caerostris darwini TaxID=1538125 RepID=A0AAV4N7B2_9ARAC|nr:hypothetical protein CDAR_301671 [Caerostris darwini]
MTQTFREIQPWVIENEKFTQPPVETLVVGSRSFDKTIFFFSSHLCLSVRTRPDGISPHFIVPVSGCDSTSNMCTGLTEANLGSTGVCFAIFVQWNLKAMARVRRFFVRD